MKNLTKKTLCIILAFMLLFAATACTKVAEPTATKTPVASVSSAATKAPVAKLPEVIKIGYLIDLTGINASIGLFLKEGFELYLKQVNSKFGDVKVELIIEDTASAADVSVTKAQKLVENNKVDWLVGCVAANSAAAVGAYAVDKKVPFMVMGSTDALTQHQYSEYVMRPSMSSSSPQFSLADYAYNEMGLRTVAAVALDFAYLYEQLGSFKITFEKLGGKVTEIQWVPMTGKDFGAYVNKISTNVDGLYDGIAGGNTGTFLQELRNYGWKKPIIGTTSVTDESLFEGIGDAGIGVITSNQYSCVLDTPANKSFSEIYKKEYGHGPSTYSEVSYSDAMILDKMYTSIFEAGKDYKDIKVLNEAFNAISIDLPRGHITIENNNAVQDYYIRRLEKVNGELQNTVLKTAKSVSQWGPYTKEERLAKPLFSKEWPFNAK